MNATVNLPAVTIAKLVAAISSLPGVRFVGVTYRSKETGELARHVFTLGASYENVLKNSMEQVTAKLPTLSGIHEEAARKVIASFSKSLLHLQTGTENPNYTQAGMWTTLCPGLRYDESTGKLQISGMSQSKVVLEAGTYGPDTRRPLTKAQDDVKAGTPASKWRTLSVEADALESVRIGGAEIDVANA